MIEVFGTRWLPFEQELENCTDSAKGYGIHGVPCKFDAEKNLLIEEENSVGCYNSDGCLRLRMHDIEEIFSIVVTKPTIIEIVKSKQDAILPMLKENFLGDDK
jgi:lipoprotein-anchoring transpeptidase ErfK/SrfK